MEGDSAGEGTWGGLRGLDAIAGHQYVTRRMHVGNKELAAEAILWTILSLLPYEPCRWMRRRQNGGFLDLRNTKG